MFDPDAFSSAFVLPEAQPSPEPEPEPNDETGPWISHGTIHVGHKPNH